MDIDNSSNLSVSKLCTVIIQCSFLGVGVGVNCGLTSFCMRHVSIRLIIKVWSRVGRWLISNDQINCRLKKCNVSPLALYCLMSCINCTS